MEKLLQAVIDDKKIMNLLISDYIVDYFISSVSMTNDEEMEDKNDTAEQITQITTIILPEDVEVDIDELLAMAQNEMEIVEMEMEEESAMVDYLCAAIEDSENIEGLIGLLEEEDSVDALLNALDNSLGNIYDLKNALNYLNESYLDAYTDILMDEHLRKFMVSKLDYELMKVKSYRLGSSGGAVNILLRVATSCINEEMPAEEIYAKVYETFDYIRVVNFSFENSTWYLKVAEKLYGLLLVKYMSEGDAESLKLNDEEAEFLNLMLKEDLDDTDIYALFEPSKISNIIKMFIDNVTFNNQEISEELEDCYDESVKEMHEKLFPEEGYELGY